MAPRKYRTRPRPDSGMWWEVEPVVYRRADGGSVARLRVTLMPGRYYLGDYASVLELRAKVRGFDLAELVPVDDDSDEAGLCHSLREVGYRPNVALAVRSAC